MLPPVFATLKTSSDVKAIVGQNPPRIYRHGDSPQRQEGAPMLPYITWQLISGIPENNLSDPPPVDRQSVQVDCWHPSDTGVETLSNAVRDAIEPVAHMTSVNLDQRDIDTKLYRISLSFDFWGR